MKYSEYQELKIKEIVKRHGEYEFPLFLTMLRKAIGYTRVTCSIDTGISCTRLHFLEAGRFKKIDKWEVHILAAYYGVPEKLLNRKANSFIRKSNRLQKGDKDDSQVIDDESFDAVLDNPYHTPTGQEVSEMGFRESHSLKHAESGFSFTTILEQKAWEIPDRKGLA